MTTEETEELRAAAPQDDSDETPEQAETATATDHNNEDEANDTAEAPETMKQVGNETDTAENPYADPDVYEIEKIVRHRGKGDRTQYLIKWRGYPASQNSWEPASNILNKEVLRKYHQEQVCVTTVMPETSEEPPNTRSSESDKTVEETEEEETTPRKLTPPPRRQKLRKRNEKRRQVCLLIKDGSLSVKISKYTAAILIVLMFGLIPILSSTPVISVAYDCTVTKSLGVYEYPTVPSCDHNMQPTNSEMHHFEAEVYRYAPQVTKFKILLCSFATHEYGCDWTDIFGSADKTYHYRPVRVSPTQCLEAFKTKRIPQRLYYHAFPYFHAQLFYKTKADTPWLNQIEATRWRTELTAYHDCEWGDYNTKIDYEFDIQEFDAQVIGNASTIEQHVTTTQCKTRLLKGVGSCRPAFKDKRVIAWEDPHHNTTVMVSLGRHTIQRQGNYFLIPSLHVGGATQREFGLDKGVIQLDNGLVIRNVKSTTAFLRDRRHAVSEYGQKVSAAGVAPMLEAHIIRTIMMERQAMTREWERLCFVQREIKRIQHWMIATFPGNSAEWVHQQQGIRVKPVGDGLEVMSCTSITNFTLRLDRRFGGKCYQDFPVRRGRLNRTYFLRLSDRQLLRISPEIECGDRPERTYIRSHTGEYYEVFADGTSYPVNISTDAIKESIVRLKPIRGYDVRLLKHQPSHLDPYTMMQVLSYVHDAVTDLKRIKMKEGNGNVLTGIGKALGTAIQGVATGGSTIISAVGGAIHDVFDGAADLDEKIVSSLGNAASKVITSTGGAVKDATSGVGHMFHGIFGGIGGTIKWALILGLIVIVLVINRTFYRAQSHNLPCSPSRMWSQECGSSNHLYKSSVRKKTRLPHS